MSTNPTTLNAQIPPDVSPRLKRKLEKHLAIKAAKRPRAHRKALQDNGPKPKWIKSLSVRESEKTLREFDAIASSSEIYRIAFERGNVPLLWQMRQDVENRVYGKPYTAINPAERPQNPINQDNRLQVAIQNLILPASKAKQKRIKGESEQNTKDIRTPLTLAGHTEPAPGTDANPIQAPAKPGDGQEN